MGFECSLHEQDVGGVGFSWEVVEDMGGGAFLRLRCRFMETAFQVPTIQASHAPVCILKAQLFQNANADAEDKRY